MVAMHMDRVRVRLALPEVLSLGLVIFCFSDGARIKCDSPETDRRAWPLVDGGEPFS
jgi:hypothetical protein